MATPQYIAIEGPIGAGKTSLAKQLAVDLNAQLILEQPAQNPFLADFYTDRERHALATQLAFLLARYEQQNELLQAATSLGPVICDYSFNKDWIFARLNLDEQELALYKKVYRLLVERLPKPDLVIYLESEPSLLKKHIKQRNEAYEKNLSLEYLEEVLEAYKSFFFGYNETPLLVANCSQIDFVNNEGDYKNLLREVFSDKRGSKHYVALGN